jgi:hypothetical protein
MGITNLRDYQTDLSDNAAQLLKTYKIAYLAMEVRTGKTITSLAAAYKYGAKTVLFVTKKKAITDIIEQAKQMGFDMEIYVTNYEQLKYVEEKFDVVIVDEAHSLAKYPKPSMRAYDIKRIAKGTPIIYLSGTPTPESFSQIYHQFWVSDYSPFKEYKSFYRWADDYVNVKKKYISGNSHNDYKDANELLIREKTQHLFLTFTQQEAGFMQMVQENIFYVKMEDSTYKFAEKLIKDKVVTNKDGESVLAETGVKLMQKLHQIYSGTVIIDQPLRRAKVFDNTKAEFIREKFSHLNKIAVFYKFTAEMASLIDVFDKQICLDAQEFAKRDSGVYISQIVSGREGINLSSAEALIFLNIDFSATSYWQARARIQTKDREQEAQIYWIFAYNGIEDKIYKAVSDKKDYTLNYFKKDYL